MLLFPWKMYGEYADGFSVEVGGEDEEDCMERLASCMEKHGDLIFYTGVSNEDYEAGEYIGRDNFIYD